jgi:hypothetical protein
VVSEDARSQPGLGLPFLDSPNLERLKRTREIADEVCEYLSKATEIARQRRANIFLPQKDIDEESLPPSPDCLEWAERVKSFGLPFSHSWLDHPKWFIQDLEAVEYGRDMYRAKQEEAAEQEVSVSSLEMLALEAARNAPSMV